MKTAFKMKSGNSPLYKDLGKAVAYREKLKPSKCPPGKEWRGGRCQTIKTKGESYKITPPKKPSKLGTIGGGEYEVLP